MKHLKLKVVVSLLCVACFGVPSVGAQVAILATQISPMMAEPETGTVSGVKGLHADVLDEILVKRLGITWKGQCLPWARAQLEVKAGSADLLITIPTDERREYAVVSDHPVFEQYLHVYTYRGHPQIEAIRQIKSVADIKNLGLLPLTNFGNGWFKENIESAGIPAYYGPADENIAEMLAARRADIIIDLPLSMNPTIKALGIESRLEMTPARFGPLGFHLLVSKKSPLAARMEEINRAIDTSIGDGTREALTAKYLAE